jgi:hypothetical protein
VTWLFAAFRDLKRRRRRATHKSQLLTEFWPQRPPALRDSFTPDGTISTR